MAVKKKMARKNMTETKIRPIESYEYLRPRRFVAWFYASRARAMFSVRLPEGRGSPQGYFGVA
jgi:hypothetical protein